MDRYEDYETCGACGGEGSIEHPSPQWDDPFYAVVLKCEECGGSGFIEKRYRPERPCPPIAMQDGDCPF